MEDRGGGFDIAEATLVLQTASNVVIFINFETAHLSQAFDLYNSCVLHSRPCLASISS